MRFLYIDWDGVLANFDKETAKYPDQNPSNVCRTVNGFYINLELYEGAKKFIDALEKLYPNQVQFLTASILERPEAWSEKVIWGKMHFPEYINRLIMVKSKEAVGSIGDILVDDHPTWNGADKFRGKIIKFNTNNIPNEYDRIIKLIIMESVIPIQY